MTLFSAFSWLVITFVDDSTKKMTIGEDTDTDLCVRDEIIVINGTCSVQIPRLLIKSWYPWNAMSGTAYYLTFIVQLYYLIYSMMQANQADTIFSSWVLFCCEQLVHLMVISFKFYNLLFRNKFFRTF